MEVDTELVDPRRWKVDTEMVDKRGWKVDIEMVTADGGLPEGCRSLESSTIDSYF